MNRSTENSIWKLFMLKIETFINCLIYILLNLKTFFGGFVGTRRLKHSKSRQRCLVLGTGPSINRLNWHEIRHLKETEKLQIFATNYLLTSISIDPLLIDYLVLSDEVTHPKSVDPRTKQLWELLRSNQHIRLITPSSWHQKVHGLGCQNHECLHFNDGSLEGFTKNTSPLWPRGYTSMTAYKAIAYADYLGFSTILIAGIENSWHLGLSVNNQNRMLQNSVHFSEDYMQAVEISQHYKMGVGDYFYELSWMFISLKRAFSKMNVVNLVSDSLVDVFRKVDPQSEDSKLIF